MVNKLFGLNKNKNITLSLVMIFITAGFIIYRDLFNNGIPFLVFSALCMINCITSLLPFCRGIPYSEMILIVLAFEFFIAILNRKNIFDFKYFVPILLIIVIELVDYLYYDIFSDVIIYLTVYMLFVSFAVFNKIFSGYERSALIMYSICTFLAIFSVIIREVNTYGLDYILTYNIRFGANVEGLKVTNFNANELGLYCSVAVALLLVLNYNKKNIFLFIFSIFLSILGIVSISRTYILVIVILWLLYLLTSGLSLVRVGLIIFVFFFSFLVLFNLLPEFMDWIFNYLGERGQEVTEDGFGGRFSLISFYNTKIFDNVWSFLFGYSQKYLQITHAFEASHNAIQETVVCWGITGLIIGIYWIVLLLKSSIVKSAGGKIKFFYFVPIIIFLLFVQTIQLFTMNCYLFALLISIIPLSMKKGEVNG